MFLEPIAAVGRVADAELRLGLRTDATLEQIAPRSRPDIVRQRSLKILRRTLHHIEQALAGFLPCFLALVARRHRYARHAREFFDRLGKTHPGLLGEEAEMVAGHAAAEAMIDAL